MNIECYTCEAAVTHLPSREVFGVFIEVVDVGAERLKVWNDKLLPKRLGEQNNVALDTSRTRDKRKCLSWWTGGPTMFVLTYSEYTMHVSCCRFSDKEK